jgi:hypothetical protein
MNQVIRLVRRPELASVARCTVTMGFLVGAGCVSIGPRALHPVQVQFNETIARTLDEQLLLNLVRLRHRENPYFLQVGSVTSQLSLTATGVVGADIGLGDGASGTTVRPNLGLNWTVTPTVTFAPLQGKEFARSLLSSVPFEVLLHLMESGWKLDRLLRVLVNRINFTTNATEVAGPMPENAEFQDFIALAENLRSLQKEHLLVVDQICSKDRSCTESDSQPSNPEAQNPGEGKEKEEKPGGPDQGPSRLEKTWALLIYCKPGCEDLIRQAISCLRLGTKLKSCPSEDSRASFLKYTIATVPLVHEEPVVNNKGLPLWRPPEPPPLVFHLRSVLGVMFYLSQAIKLPEAEQIRNEIRVPSNLYKDLFCVEVRDAEPAAAYIKVHYRGHWYSIRQDDGNSQATFMLLSQLFGIQAGNVSVLAPALTLPVGR